MEITTGGVIYEVGKSTRMKTGEWRTFKPIVKQEKCTKCGLCELYCPEGCIFIKSKVRIDYDYCKGCGICANECPAKAIDVVREKK